MLASSLQLGDEVIAAPAQKEIRERETEHRGDDRGEPEFGPGGEKNAEDECEKPESEEGIDDQGLHTAQSKERPA